jgi:hypothetical protein
VTRGADQSSRSVPDKIGGALVGHHVQRFHQLIARMMAASNCSGSGMLAKIATPKNER